MSRSSITMAELLANPHPGEILLKEFLQPMTLSQTALARAIGVPPRRINEIVLGKRAITADTDLRLARYFGLSDGFFLQLQADHDLMARRRQIGEKLKSILGQEARRHTETQDTIAQTQAGDYLSMSPGRQTNAYSIGWDVGGWNCDVNTRSRDAIVILNDNLGVVGTPWRGNLRKTINKAITSRDWIFELFDRCKSALVDTDVEVTLAIDTPLGFSTEFQRLVTSRISQSIIGLSDTNPYLYRKTERLLFERNKRPLSAIKDMIGSQATKGMHVLAKFARDAQRCGVWSDGQALTAIEAYPASCKESKLANELLKTPKLGVVNDDIRDAATCAVIAHIFRTNQSALWAPSDEIPINEGWIWLPNDAFVS